MLSHARPKQLELFRQRGRMSYRPALLCAAAGLTLCVSCWLAWGIRTYWDSPHLINFLASWIPLVFSILFAFVPSGREMKHEWVKWTWRTGVIAVGLFCSVLLWHQQAVNDEASTLQINHAVSTAVSSANSHTDQKFSGVATQVDSVQQKIQDIGKELEQDANNIDANIGKVGKPAPAVRPKLDFSLWNEESSQNIFPEQSEALAPDALGNYDITFAIRNDSSVAAQGIEEWVHICDGCMFVGEPKGFDRPQGMSDKERHRSIPGMNPGVTIIEGNKFKVRPPPNSARFALVFKSTCGTCGGVTTTKEFWIVESSFSLPQ